MFSVTRTHEICCGHRVYGHESKCSHLHGHNYTFELTCKGDLDGIGRVIDFGVIKTTLCQWLEEHWDHRMLIWEKDPILEPLLRMDLSVCRVPFNPTAENLAQYLCDELGPAQLTGTGVYLSSCRVHETAKCSAYYEVPR